jgi:hypothetical protein
MLILRFESEDDQSLFVSLPDGEQLALPKNRAVPRLLLLKRANPLTPAFHLLGLAFVGLAPAGLGTLFLAPLAALWALIMLITRPLAPADRKRVVVVGGIAAMLLGIAIPLSKIFFARLP